MQGTSKKIGQRDGMLKHEKWCVCVRVCVFVFMCVMIFLLPDPAFSSQLPSLCACCPVYSFYFLQSHMFVAVIAVAAEWLTLS